MKIVTSLIVSLLLISSGIPAAADATDEPVKRTNLFTLKTEKEFVGALVEVYNSSGELITSQSLQKRKMVIDFGSAGFGMYTIRIVKGKAKQEFKYVKK